MAETKTFPYGEPDWETIKRWLGLDPATDGPVWMLNLMKYRSRASYRDGRQSELTGKEADDAYAPLGPLAAVGATVAFFGDVTDQAAGDPAFDRVAIVRYPTRASFFEMQERDDFKHQHEHKEAGMEFTIVAGCVPDPSPAGEAQKGPLVLRLRRFAEGTRPAADPQGVTPVAHFAVDGVVLGDHRRWHDARIDRVDPDDVAALTATAGVDEQVVVVVAPTIDHLAASLHATTSGVRP